MHPFFDSIIFLYLIASSTLAIGIFSDRKRADTWEYRHQSITLTVSMFLCFSALVVLWGAFIEPRRLTVNRVAIDLPNFAPTQPVRVVLISDVHVGTYKKSGWVKRIAKRIAHEKPDLVLIAGDFIVNKPEHAQYLSDFQLLTTDYRTYAVLGDHDYGVQLKPTFSINEALAQTVEDALVDAGAQVLKNETRTLELNGARFTLIGLDDWLAQKTDMQHAYNQLPNYLITQLPTIVLVHNPDFILDPQSKNADLILAGNTHGGQIRLPFDGPVPLLPSRLPRSFDEGLFVLSRHSERSEESRTDVRSRIRERSFASAQDDNQLLFITSGVGESGPRARLFNPPEIVLLELH